MRRRLIAAFAAMMVAVTVMGCGGKTKDAAAEEDKVSEQEEEPEEEEPAELSEEEEQELYNLYIGLNNTMVGRLSTSLSKYYEYVDFQEEFTLLDDKDYFCYSIADSVLEDLDRADALVARKQERSDVDEAYAALSPVARELIQALNDVQEYTDEDSFLEDDYAKGKELHAVVWRSSNEYETLGVDFIEKLSSIASAQRAEDLAQLKEDGYEVTYALVSMITTAQEIQTAIYAQEIDDESLLQLDIEAIRPLYEQYKEEVQAVLAYMNDEEALSKEGYPTQSAYYATFKEAAENSEKELDEIFRKVEEQEEPSGYGISIINSFTVDGSIAGYDNKVSAMINDYNRMISY